MAIRINIKSESHRSLDVPVRLRLKLLIQLAGDSFLSHVILTGDEDRVSVFRVEQVAGEVPVCLKVLAEFN
jgi:hypothetical protein